MFYHWVLCFGFCVFTYILFGGGVWLSGLGHSACIWKVGGSNPQSGRMILLLGPIGSKDYITVQKIVTFYISI